MTESEIEAFADLIHDAAIQYANGRVTDFRPVARQIAEASRRAAIKEAASFMDKRADELGASGDITGITMARIYRVEAASIRSLSAGDTHG